MNKLFICDHRAILEIKGKESFDLLQGLITNDIFRIKDNQLLYTAMLNSKGRFFCDFFAFTNREDCDKIIIDCPKMMANELKNKLNFYKLRKNITIEIVDNWLIAIDTNSDRKGLEDINKINKSKNINYFSFQDPRKESFLNHIYYYSNDNDKNQILQLRQELESIGFINNINDYHSHRIKNRIIEGDVDLTIDKSIIAEFDFDNLNAICYDKGCYIGQELTARTHYLGKIRKKIAIFTITDDNDELLTKILGRYYNAKEDFLIKDWQQQREIVTLFKSLEIFKKNSKIEEGFNDKSCGNILTISISNNKIIGLAIIDTPDEIINDNMVASYFDNNQFYCKDFKIELQ
jgi:folate-binding protein YgfZ